MSKNRNAVFKIASVYIGTVIGAGFASGQEIVQFFTVYGIKGMYGLVFIGIVFSLLGWAVLELVYEYRIKDYQDLLRPIMGNTLANVVEIIVTISLFISFCAMIAGSGALLQQRFQLSIYVGILGMVIACFLTFLYDVKGIVMVNTFLVPILFFGGILLALYVIIFRDITVFAWMGTSFRKIRYHWFSSSVLYVSYNSLTAIVVLTTLLPYIMNRKVARRGGIIGGIALGMIGIFLGTALLCYRGKIEFVEIPLLEIVMYYAPIIQWIYFFVLIAAMFTTAVSNGYGFANCLSKLFSLSKNTSIFITIIGGVFVSKLGFSNIVKKVYPVFGYGGLFEISMILIYFFQYKIKSKQLQ